MTGANQGIGFVTATELARRGATVHLVCRSAPRGEAARAAIVAATGNAAVHLVVADLSSVAAAKAVAAQYLATGAPLHLLVNNAGCLVNPRCAFPPRRTGATWGCGIAVAPARHALTWPLIFPLISLPAARRRRRGWR